jgi:hypothetical protein
MKYEATVTIKIDAPDGADEPAVEKLAIDHVRALDNSGEWNHVSVSIRRIDDA